jgi:hypothetical protein
MNFDEFKNKVLSLAEDERVELRTIQALVTRYFKNKSIPFVESNHTFVVRCSINKEGEVFRNISRCSYPPDEYKSSIKIQRANYPEQQVFYCTMPTDSQFATATSTCVLETAWEHVEDVMKSRTYMTISKWRNDRPLNLWVLPFSEESCQRNKDFFLIRENMKRFINDRHGAGSEVEQALQFMSEAFSARMNKQVYYRISSAFYNSLLFYEKLIGKRYDGLLYPSANTECAGLNLVLKKDLVDNGTLRSELAMMFSMQRHPNNSKNLSVMPASNEAYPEEDGTIRFNYVQ